MSSIFSVQNLQTFLRRKNLRPPPPSRGGPPGPRPPPPYRGRSPPGRPPSDRGLSLGAAACCSGAFVSSAITLLEQWPVTRSQLASKISFGCGRNDHWPPATDQCLTPWPELPPREPPLPRSPPAARSLSSSPRAAS